MELILFAKYFGASLAIAFSALGCGFSEGMVAGKASVSIARQPKATPEILRTMLITQAVSETSGIFGLLIAFMLLFVLPSKGGESIITAYVCTGLCIGLGAVGAGLGSGIAGASACEAVARYPKLSIGIMLKTLIGQAITQTGVIFALVISLLICLNSPDNSDIAAIGAIIGSSLCMGVGAIGAGAGSGFITAKAVEGTAKNPKVSNILLRTMLLGQSVQQAKAIYCLIIAFLLIILSKNG